MSDLDKRLDNVEKQLKVITNNEISVIGGPILSQDDEIDFRELWVVVWRGKWIITLLVSLFVVGSAVYALSLPNIYKSEALLVPAEENSGGGLSALAGSFGGLASLAGVNVGSGQADKTTLAIEVLKSRKFITFFIKKYDLLVPVMAAKYWDRDKQSLVLDPKIYDASKNAWVRSAKPPRKSEPSMQEAFSAFKRRLTVTQNKATGFVTVGLEFYSPSMARSWVDSLVKELNAEIKLRDVTEAKKSIRYLNNQLIKTAVADMKKVFYELIEEQSKIVMFAEVRDEYVFRTIDEAVTPELKAKPKRVLIVMLGILLGGMLGVSLVFLNHFVKNSLTRKK